MGEKRKPIVFNTEDLLEKEMHEYAKSINFSGWAKGKLMPAALSRLAQRGIDIEPYKNRRYGS
ncbi:hypothetical protein EDM52_18575 [Brevibacillus invocatus]|uniref:Uncharacterized protein n=1 Tax=Brevibacillus invocatus TaxID=173959 RepID=A0A3M8C3E3_9BACL|nr:hypothetical protein [Brevibacillus invocatus]RNB69973.1 hypothetical protein EDM52_18575 [Brevibacillus invocatus]